MIFINNFYPGKPGDSCISWTWYLPNDFQFFLLQPLFVWLFYHRRKLGLIVFAGLQTVCWIATMIILFVYDFSSSYKGATDDYWYIYYHKPWCRIGPYMVGLLSALILYSFKNETRSESAIKRFSDVIDKSKLC